MIYSLIYNITFMNLTLEKHLMKIQKKKLYVHKNLNAFNTYVYRKLFLTVVLTFK